MFFFLKWSEFHQKAGKNACSAGKTSGLLRGDASGDNRCYVLAHCGGYPPIGKRPIYFRYFSLEGFP